MNIEQQIIRFKMQLLRKMPFYGDILMRLPFVENKNIPTACTDGRKIEYNPDFLAELTEGQRNFVLMHEVFHILLSHGKRGSEKRNHALWNTAADMVVNHMLLNLMHSMDKAKIPFDKPKAGIFAFISDNDTVENIYEKLLLDNKTIDNGAKKVYVSLRSYRFDKSEMVQAPDDIVISESGGSPESAGLSEQAILQIVRESAVKNRSSLGSYFVPEQIFGIVESKKINWQKLLRDFFVEELSDETSYTTPERKYIHMDLILPGHSLDYKTIEEIWAFVDCSGSIGKNEMEQFLTQLYRISKEFKCIFNICYWDTEVNDVYKKILKEDDILKSIPHHSGGTDINCVYRWIKENRVKPDVMLILTDGYFGPLDQSTFIPSLRQKTILVLSSDIGVDDDMKRIGKITRL